MTLPEAFDLVAKEFPKDIQYIAPRWKDRWPKIVEQAKILVCSGERQQVYGPPEKNWARVAKRWFARVTKKWSIRMDQDITPGQCAWLMYDMKLARLEQSPDHFDSILDAAGYNGIATYLDHVSANA